MMMLKLTILIVFALVRIFVGKVFLHSTRCQGLIQCLFTVFTKLVSIIASNVGQIKAQIFLKSVLKTFATLFKTKSFIYLSAIVLLLDVISS